METHQLCRPLTKQAVPSMGSMTQTQRALRPAEPLSSPKAVFGKTFGEPPANEVLDALVGDADHVLAIAALVLHIQCLALTVIGHAELRSFQRKALGAGIAGVDVEVAHGGFPGQKRHSRRT